MRLIDIIRGAFEGAILLDKILVNQGRILSRCYKTETFPRIEASEFQVFSQWGEDGIIQYLTQNIRIDHKNFVEFGVETFIESNCRFLMQKDFWSGFIIDGSSENISKIRRSSFYWRHNLTALDAFITRENVSELINKSGFEGIGILSIDIDGNDYFVLEALGHLTPSIIIVEYNGVFGQTATVSVPYDPEFVRSKAHYSNLYYGASIAAFDLLLSSRGYRLVGGNSAGNNAFFVREDLLNDKIQPVTVADVYHEASFAESRNADGGLSFLRGAERFKEISDLPLIDVATGVTLTVADISRS